MTKRAENQIVTHSNAYVAILLLDPQTRASVRYALAVSLTNRRLALLYYYEVLFRV
jgi:hypothetical protein